MVKRLSVSKFYIKAIYHLAKWLQYKILCKFFCRQQQVYFCIAPEKVLALSLYRLAHGNSYKGLGQISMLEDRLF